MSEGTSPKRILYDIPVSNNGARCRIILYKKDIPTSEVAIKSPADLGGLKSDTYLQLNPQGKMPLLVCTELNMNIPESDTIARYLLSEYADKGPSFLPENPKSNLIARLHDIYIGSIQTCMYKAPPFGTFRTRRDALDELVKQLMVIEDLIDPSSGMYLCGEISLADATLFPTAIFIDHMLPKYDIYPALPPKMAAWFNCLKEKDPVFQKVFDEVKGGLNVWDANKRWDGLLGAGWRDNEPRTFFDKLVTGDIPADIVMQNDKILAFKDINPAAPAHVLVIPKDRSGLTRLRKATVEHKEILGELMVAAAEIARDESLGFGDGARVVINDGPDGGQEVMHLHVHVLGGRSMQWPPG
jgi:diadenosine tetraphosphate (Ap4A) HIT family hydrolase/glutathione S-transferase